MYITGYKAIQEYINKNGAKAVLYAADVGTKGKELVERAQNVGCTIVHVSDQKLSAMVPESKHRGLVLETEKPSSSSTNLRTLLETIREQERSLLILLDSLQDPHNLGAIIRTCDQLAVEGVILPERRSVKDNRTVARVSSGADAFVPIVTVVNLTRTIEELKKEGFWVYGAGFEGETISSVAFPQKTALVMGSEGKGLHKRAGEACDRIISIPAYGHVDSYNVSVAAGILMYEIRKQQKLF
jgi:23S rRNA (guanosine2251-2'-O)-methyltransferase